MWSKPLAIITMGGVLILMYAGIQPPFDILINYAIGLIVLLLVGWFAVERNRFKGPPIGDEIKKRQAAIAAAEKALDAAAETAR